MPNEFLAKFPAGVWQNTQITLHAFSKGVTIQHASADLTRAVGSIQQFYPEMELILALYGIVLFPKELAGGDAVITEWLSSDERTFLESIRQKCKVGSDQDTIKMMRNSLAHADFIPFQPVTGPGLPFIFRFQNHRRESLTWECELSTDDVARFASIIGKALVKMCLAGAIRDRPA